METYCDVLSHTEFAFSPGTLGVFVFHKDNANIISSDLCRFVDRCLNDVQLHVSPY